MQQQSYGTNNQQQLYILPLIFAWLHNLNSLSDIIFLLVNKVAKKKFGSGLAENPNYKEKRYTSVTKLSMFYSKR